MRKEILIRDGKEYIMTEDGRMFFPERELKWWCPKREMWIHQVRKAREARYSVMDNGYKRGGKMLIHRAMAFAFLGEPPQKNWTVNHKDGNKLNNHYTNLEWMPHQNNMMHWINSDKGIDDRKVHPIEVRTVDGDFVGVFRAKQDAAKALGIWKPTITGCIKGKYKQSGGYTFRELSKEEYYALQKANK